MPDPTELHARLLADARGYDPDAHHRSLLGPYRDVLLLWRAKFMSYEQIAATLTRHGIRVSAAGVGVFCRKHFTKAEIERARMAPAKAGGGAPAARLPSSRPVETDRSRGGPRVARDDF